MGKSSLVQAETEKSQGQGNPIVDFICGGRNLDNIRGKNIIMNADPQTILEAAEFADHIKTQLEMMMMINAVFFKKIGSALYETEESLVDFLKKGGNLLSPEGKSMLERSGYAELVYAASVQDYRKKLERAVESKYYLTSQGLREHLFAALQH